MELLYCEHCLLMAMGWLVFVPAAIYLATVGKRDQLPYHDYHHSITILIGMACILVGGVLRSHLPDHPNPTSSIHDTLGSIFNIAIFLQPVFGITAVFMSDDNSMRDGFISGIRYASMLIYYGGTTNAFFRLLLYLHCFVADGPLKNALFFTAGILFLIEAYVLVISTLAWYENNHPVEQPNPGIAPSSEVINKA